MAIHGYFLISKKYQQKPKSLSIPTVISYNLFIEKRKLVSYNYGQAHYRGEQVHLFGRWHIDDQNCMTFG